MKNSPARHRPRGSEPLHRKQAIRKHKICTFVEIMAQVNEVTTEIPTASRGSPVGYPQTQDVTLWGSVFLYGGVFTNINSLRCTPLSVILSGVHCYRGCNGKNVFAVVSGNRIAEGSQGYFLLHQAAKRLPFVPRGAFAVTILFTPITVTTINAVPQFFAPPLL